MVRITKPIEERRKEIIDTARILFVNKGYDETAISDIATNINIASGLIYHYFKSKKLLFYAVIDEIVMEEAVLKEKIISECSGQARECLKLLFAQKASHFEKYGKLLASFENDQTLICYVEKKKGASIESLIISLIDRGNKDGSWNCKYVKETTALILYGINGINEFNEPVLNDIISRILNANLESSI